MTTAFQANLTLLLEEVADITDCVRRGLANGEIHITEGMFGEWEAVRVALETLKPKLIALEAETTPEPVDPPERMLQSEFI